MKISIIGTGIYSLALALNIKSDYNINMWSENIDLVKNFQEKHSLDSLSDAFIPDNINVSNDMELVLKDTNLIILGTSIKYVRETLLNIQPYYIDNTPICIATKGIENKTGYFVSEIIQEVIKTDNIAVISGATFATDLINKNRASLSLATMNNNPTNFIKNIFDKYITIQIVNDIKGLELCGSIKNVFAIASGILNGFNTSSSTRVVLMSKALTSIKNILEELNCNPETILSHAGIDDLILTCTSIESRNFTFGNLIGKQENSEEFLKSHTVEGYHTLLALKDLMHKHKLDIPIIEVIAKIVIKKENPSILIDFLFN